MSATIRKARLGDEYVEIPSESTMAPKVTIVPASQRVVVSGRRNEVALKAIADMESELGRLVKLAQQLRAELLRE